MQVSTVCVTSWLRREIMTLLGITQSVLVANPECILAGQCSNAAYSCCPADTPAPTLHRPEAQAQVSGMPGCVHKKFPTLSEAQEFVNGGTSAARAARQAASGPSYDSSSSSSKKRGRVDEQQLKTTGTGSKRVKSIRLTGTGRQENVRRVYCDGSSRGNGQAGAVAGIGVFWGDDSKLP